MSTSLRERPSAPPASSGGAAARRVVIRWAWRLFRREWRQQLLVLALLVVAVAATVAGAAIAADAPSSPDATFGSAGYLLTLPGSGRHLAAEIAAARRWFGVVDVIEHDNVAIPGSVNTVDLRAQNPAGPLGRPMLRLDVGRYPSGPGQVAVTAEVAAIFRLKLGSSWQVAGRPRTVVGLVENPQNLLDNFALVAPGQVRTPSQVAILLDGTAARVAAFRLPGGTGTPIEARPAASTNFPAIAVLVFTVIGLLFVGLVAVAGFAVMAGRRMRAFGMFAAVGAADRHIRLAVIANGAIVGAAAAVIGTVAGLAGWLAFVPRLESIAEHRIAAFSLPWPIIVAAMLLAVVTAVTAAWWPARTAARIPIVAALSGRPTRPQPGHRFAVSGGTLLGAGLGLLAFANGTAAPSSAVRVSAHHSANSHHASAPLTVAGIVATVAGMLLLSPLAIRSLAALGGRTPIAARLAIRDLARYGARSGAALAAVSLTLGIAAVIAISAAGAQAAAAIPPAIGNLPPDQLIAYSSANADPSLGFGNPIPVPTAAQVQAALAGVDSLAASLHARTILALDAAASPESRTQLPGQGASGLQPAALVKGRHTTINGKAGYLFEGPPNGGIVYVGTQALLRHYGINAQAVDPSADILTSQKNLAGYELADFASQSGCPHGATGCVVRRQPARFPRYLLPGIIHPKIQRVGLPAYTSAPKTLITMNAVRSLGLKLVPVGWLIQTPRPLTAAQVVAADHWAAAVGLTVETRSAPQTANLSRLAAEATTVGVLVALGVLAMTIGLIRRETAADLRTLTATGASGRTRRNLTGVTAGALALLGALIGIAGAYLALIAWHRGVNALAHVPVIDLVIMIVGMPVIALSLGWLLAGREPPAIARQPLV